jgi:hypothetical protein
MEIKDAAIGFEAVRYSMSQTKDGFKLTLVIHPSDIVPELTSHPIGTRYQVALVEVNDEGQPVKPKHKTDGEQAVAAAGMLCRQPQFQAWLLETGLTDEISEAHAADAVCKFCKIDSRAELATNPEALRLFNGLRLQFSQAL